MFWYGGTRHRVIIQFQKGFLMHTDSPCGTYQRLLSPSHTSLAISRLASYCIIEIN